MDNNNIKKIVSRLTEFEWEQFKLGKLLVRCRTKEDAKEFVWHCAIRHIKCINDSDETNWNLYKNDTVYHVIDGFLGFCHMKYFIEHYPDTPIIEFNYNPTPICTCDNKKDNNKIEKEEYMTTNNSTNMDFKQAMRTWNRMCDSFTDSCSPCPIHKARGNRTCRDWVGKHTDEAVKIFVKWKAEHPQKTIADDFFEKFPKAQKEGDEITPRSCAYDLGYVERCANNADCTACWRRPLEEVEE